MGLVGRVEGSTTVEEVRFAPIFPETDGSHLVERGHERRRTFDHRGVDNGAARPLAVVDGGKDACDKVHGSSAVVGNEIQRQGRPAGLADRVERTAEPDVVDVVAGHR